MLDSASIEHIGIRISDRDVSVTFCETLGFCFFAGAAYDQGRPIVIRHPSGLVVYLLGPANVMQGENILMDRPDKYPGITHVALKMKDIAGTEKALAKAGIPIPDRRHFMGMSTIFIRDPDRNLLELVGEGPDVATLITTFEAQA